jgi:hypothetical protein
MPEITHRGHLFNVLDSGDDAARSEMPLVLGSSSIGKPGTTFEVFRAGKNQLLGYNACSVAGGYRSEDGDSKVLRTLVSYRTAMTLIGNPAANFCVVDALRWNNLSLSVRGE